MRFLWILWTFLIGYLLIECLQNKNIEKFVEFIHIPKNAGTTIENIGKKSGVKWGRFKPEHQNFLNDPICNYWHVPPVYFNKGSFYDTDNTFCVIRDPFSRIISEYAYRHKDDPNMDNAKNLNAWIREVLTEENVKRGKFDCHLLPQSEYIYDDVADVYTCDNILRFEHLEADFNNLMSKENYDLKLTEKSNKTNFNLRKSDIDESNVKLIERLYARDIELWEKNKNKKT